jgi:hypothetical protein
MFHRCRMQANGERAGGVAEEGNGACGARDAELRAGQTQPAAAMVCKLSGLAKLA